MKSLTLWYAVEEHGADEFHECTIKYPYDDHRLNAEKCAENFWYEHAGWECSWPLTFLLKETEDGTVVGTYSVDREYSPSFYASRKGE